VLALGGEVVGVSVDDLETQCAFAESVRAGFPMIADDDRSISRAFGVAWPLIKLAQRVTFVIDGAGYVRGVFHHEFQISKHLDESLALLKEMQAKAKR
jgi:peroxiredoxin Q/BCP